MSVCVSVPVRSGLGLDTGIHRYRDTLACTRKRGVLVVIESSQQFHRIFVENLKLTKHYLLKQRKPHYRLITMP